jgi:hypothetical protein
MSACSQSVDRTEVTVNVIDRSQQLQCRRSPAIRQHTFVIFVIQKVNSCASTPRSRTASVGTLQRPGFFRVRDALAALPPLKRADPLTADFPRLRLRRPMTWPHLPTMCSRALCRAASPHRVAFRSCAFAGPAGLHITSSFLSSSPVRRRTSQEVSHGHFPFCSEARFVAVGVFGFSTCRAFPFTGDDRHSPLGRSGVSRINWSSRCPFTPALPWRQACPRLRHP